jgi:hypothetical protein
MVDFNIHVRFYAADVDDAAAQLDEYAEQSSSIAVGESEGASASGDDDVIIPDQYLEVQGVETFADLYDDLRNDPAVADLVLWGPTADKYVVPVEHYALQQIESPQLYDFHAIDNQTTLVIAESEMEMDEVRTQVPPAAQG